MGDSDINFVLTVIFDAKRIGHGISRDLVKNAYMRDIQMRGVREPPIVSEKWIDYYWNRLSSIPYERLEKASHSRERLTKLLISLLGK